MANTGERRHGENVALKSEHDELVARLNEAREAGLDRAAARLERKLARVKDDFAKSNWGLAVSFAREFFPHGDANHANSDDYVAAALMGLWEAFGRWDPEKGSFSHWSRMFIEGATKRAVQALEAPEGSYGDFTARPKVRAAKARLETELGRLPTDAEIAAVCGETPELVNRALAARPVSLDTPVGEDEGTLGDLVTGGIGLDLGANKDSFAAMFDELDGSGLQTTLSVLGRAELTPTELWVVARHHGLDGASPESLLRIGEVIEKGRQTVQRHSAKAETAIRSL
jgi:RNA polymerase primary sigma factor